MNLGRMMQLSLLAALLSISAARDAWSAEATEQSQSESERQARVQQDYRLIEEARSPAETTRFQEAARREATSFLESNYWETPEGRRRAEWLERERFYDALKSLVELSAMDWPTRYDAGLERWVLQDRDQAKDLEKATRELIDYVERLYRLDSIEVQPLRAEESLDDQISKMRRWVRQVVPETLSLTSGDLLDIERFRRARVSLVEIRLLSQALRNED